MAMRERLAKLVSNILNPFLVSAVIITLLAFKTTSSAIDVLKWVLISVTLSVLPVFIAVMCLLRFRKLDSFFANPREQRNSIYVLASLVGAIGCGILWYFKAPELLAVAFTAGLISIIVFMAINYFWKISLHTGFTAASVAVAIMVYGVTAAWSVIFLPLVGWARIELKQHTLGQVIAGGLLAAAIVSGVFWGFGVVG